MEALWVMTVSYGTAGPNKARAQGLAGLTLKMMNGHFASERHNLHNREQLHYLFSSVSQAQVLVLKQFPAVRNSWFYFVFVSSNSAQNQWGLLSTAV